MGKNTMRLDLSGFKEMMTELDRLGGDLKEITEDALTQAGETIADDTMDAVQDSNLPAGGKFHHKGNPTESSIVKNPKVEWEGMTGSIGVGFDYSKPGAGGLLISGTPRMKPDQELKKIYKNKKYMSQIEDDMKAVISDAINKRMGG